MKMNLNRLALPLLAVGCIASPNLRAEDGLSASVGLEYSIGDYGSPLDTQILSIPFNARLDTGPWTFQATLPYLRLKGPGDVIPDIGRVGSVKGRRKGTSGAPSTNVETRESGIGDLVGAATYRLPLASDESLVLDFTGKIKIATADEDKGLGTGEHDFSFQVDASKAYTPQLTLTGGLGYAVLGSSDATPLDNIFFANLGASYKLSDPLSAAVSMEFREAASSFGDERIELRATLGYALDTNLKVQGYLLKGFADGGPDYGFGAYVVWRF